MAAAMAAAAAVKEQNARFAARATAAFATPVVAAPLVMTENGRSRNVAAAMPPAIAKSNQQLHPNNSDGTAAHSHGPALSHTSNQFGLSAPLSEKPATLLCLRLVAVP